MFLALTGGIQMIKLTDHGVFLKDGKVSDSADISAAEARKNFVLITEI